MTLKSWYLFDQLVSSSPRVMLCNYLFSSSPVAAGVQARSNAGIDQERDSAKWVIILCR